MSKKVKAILSRFKKRVISELAGQIERIVVYGSYARGEARAYSDLDILVIAKEKSAHLESRIRDIAYDIMWEQNFAPLISVEILEKDSFDKLGKLGSSFHRNIQNEGISL
jgi:predicted nucleotidyltransferase